MLRPERLDADFDDPEWTRGDLIAKPTVGEELPKPLTSPAPGRWSHPPERRRDLRPTIDIVFAIGGYAVVIPTTFYIECKGAMGDFSGAFIAMAVYIAAFATYSWTVNRVALRAEPRDLALLEDRDDAEVAVVQIGIVRDGRTVGRDRGVAWFANGLFLFSGHATSFALGGEDVLPPSQIHDSYRRYKKEDTYRPSLPETALPLRLDDGWAYVIFEPLHGGDSIEDKREFRFLKAFAEFRRNPPLSHGTRQWPPFEP